MKKMMHFPELASSGECNGCSACFSACPRQAIAMREDDEGFLRPVVDGAACVGCGLCEKACPFAGTLLPPAPLAPAACYVARSREQQALARSTSGALFWELAACVIADGGVVYGCVWKDGRACHAAAETLEDVREMQGSKYVPSDLGASFADCRKHLLAGRRVLFSGTPCQIVGLRSFLGREDPLLVTVSLMCHGVPSASVFRAYVAEEEAARGGCRVTRVVFRDKRPGETASCLTLQFADGEERVYSDPYGTNAFLRAFLRDYCLRPSCHRCEAKKRLGMADLVIGDFWGIERFDCGYSTREGASAVLVNTDAGRGLFERIGVDSRPMSFSDVLAGNPQLVSSAARRPRRAVFMSRYRETGVARALAEAEAGSVLTRALRLFRRIVCAVRRRIGVRFVNRGG